MSTARSRKMAEARISRAIAGFQIPMLSITKLCDVLGDAIKAGKSDAELRALVAACPGVKEG